MEDNILQNLRKYSKPTFEDVPVENLQYAAGLSDTDGCFQIKDGITPMFYISQAEKGIGALHFMYNAFGGEVTLHRKGNENHQTAYSWCLFGEDSKRYSEIISPHLLIKKREAILLVQFPLVKLIRSPIVAEHSVYGEVKEFATIVECSDYLGIKKFHSEKLSKTFVHNGWTIKRKYTDQELTEFADKKKAIDKKLREYHHSPHDDIPEDVVPSIPWIAGIMDAEGTFDTNGKSGMHHSITQKYQPLLNLFKRLYGGSVWHRKGSDTWAWSVYTEAKRLTQEIAPYIHGKKKQVDLLLDMKPGEAPQIHLKLRELKGNHTAPTPRIDALKAGAPGIKSSVTKPHTAPKELPAGVFYQNKEKTRIKAQVQYKKKIYVIGFFEPSQVEEAHKLYLEYKNAISLEKRGGPKVEFGDLTCHECK